MARMVAIYRMPQDPAAFRKHYFETHVPLATWLPGLRRYEVSEGPVVSPAGGPVHFVATLHFDDMAAIRAAFASAAGQACAADRRQLAPVEGDAIILLFDERAV